MMRLTYCFSFRAVPPRLCGELACFTHGLRRRKNWALPVSDSCTLRLLVVMVGVFVTVVQVIADSEDIVRRFDGPRQGRGLSQSVSPIG